MRHAESQHAGREIVSVTHDNPRHRYTYADAFKRTRQLANALKSLRLDPFDRVATLAWNDYRHFELYYGISCSGSACPLSIMDEFRIKHGLETFHAWGMTETSPLGTMCTPKPGFDALREDEKQLIRAKQGRPVFGVDLKIIDDEGKALPWDGKAFGALQVRGPWVADGYFKLGESAAHDDEGWFETGDVATIDADGYMQITDRTKDVIKSGGEWISSVDLENVAVGHPAVKEAAVIGVAHPKWAERPLLIIVADEDAGLTGDQVIEYMTGKIAKWWLPDDVVFVDEIPHTATGKISKLRLREQFKDYTLPVGS